MKVFLSWSGEPSQQIASVLKDWLPDVVQALAPWMSSKDIDKGEGWFQSISESLVKADGVGIFCLTKGNLVSPWMAYEAGALASQDSARVMTFLHGVKPSDIKPPLGLFQATNPAMKGDVFLLLTTLNKRCPTPLPDEKLLSSFERHWPELRARLETIAATFPEGETTPEPEAPDMLTEILTVVRRIEKDRTYTPLFSASSAFLGGKPAPNGTVGGLFTLGSGLSESSPSGALTLADQYFESLSAEEKAKAVETFMASVTEQK